MSLTDCYIKIKGEKEEVELIHLILFTLGYHWGHKEDKYFIHYEISGYLYLISRKNQLQWNPTFYEGYKEFKEITLEELLQL